MNQNGNANRDMCWKILSAGSGLSALVVAIGLLYSGLIHYQNQYFFFESVLRYNIFNVDTAAFASVGITSLSLVIGVALLVPNLRMAASLIAVCLFSAFTIAQVTAWYQGVQAGCGCFGISSSQIGLHSILIAVSFLCLSAFCFSVEFFQTKRLRLNEF